MGNKLYIVAYQSNVKWLGDGILYIGYDKEKAEEVYKNNNNVDLHIFHRIDSTIQDGISIGY